MNIIEAVEKEMLEGFGQVSDTHVAALVEEAKALRSTLRDQLAMALSQGTVAAFWSGQAYPAGWGYKEVFEETYKAADAMLTARQSSQENSNGN